jgi:glycosyltransferase involved in cell wall biosynthesis
MSVRPGITFVVPTFQRAPLLAQCLASIVPQLRDHDELIVVNDGSTDGTSVVVRDAGPGIRYIEQPNAGFPRAANAGLSQVQTEWCWVFGDDDVLLPGARDRMLQHVEHKSEVTLCTGAWQSAVRAADGASPVPQRHSQKLPEESERGIHPLLFENNFALGGASMMRTALVQELGGFDERFLRSQDYHLAIRLALRGSIALLPGDPLMLYVQHGGTRGTRAAPLPSTAVRLRWLRYDQWLYQELVASAPDALFEEPGTSGHHGLVLVNRARAAASKLLMIPCVDALVARCHERLGPLTDRERRRITDIPRMGHWYDLGTFDVSELFWRSARILRTLGPLGNEVYQLLESQRPSRARRIARVLGFRD